MGVNAKFHGHYLENLSGPRGPWQIGLNNLKNGELSLFEPCVIISLSNQQGNILTQAQKDRDHGSIASRRKWTKTYLAEGFRLLQFSYFTFTVGKIKIGWIFCEYFGKWKLCFHFWIDDPSNFIFISFFSSACSLWVFD